MRRIGMLTSGGDCQALNATMRGVAKSLYNMFDDVEIIGFEDGYKGLMYADYQIMKPSDFSGILTEGGTILGTSRQPFKLMRVPDENGLVLLSWVGTGRTVRIDAGDLIYPEVGLDYFDGVLPPSVAE